MNMSRLMLVVLAAALLGRGSAQSGEMEFDDEANSSVLPPALIDPTQDQFLRNLPTDSYAETSHSINSCEVARRTRQKCGQQENTSEEYCLALGCCWDPTHDEHENKTHCYHRDVAVSEFKPNAYVISEAKCSGDKTYALGDVNADGISDQICRGGQNVEILIGDSSSDVPSPAVTFQMNGCDGTGDNLKMGDVNGDGRSDLVCVAYDGGITVWMSKQENELFYDSEPFRDDLFGFCASYTSSEVFLSDFNGDGYADLLCVPSDDSAKRSLALGGATGTFRAPVDDPNFEGFCSFNKLMTGDFDADGRSDLICREGQGTSYKIALTDGDGLLVNEDFRQEGSWCELSDDTFLVGDFNGDHHDDWVCHHGDGSVCVRYNSHIFGADSMFMREICDDIDWGTDKVFLMVGDQNGDGMDDLFSQNGENTNVAITTVKAPSVNFLQVDWDSDIHWAGTKFCKDKELYVGDVNNDQKVDVVCHEDKGGLMQRILGDFYGRLIYENKWSASEGTDDPFRFCHKDHENPEYPSAHIGDVDGNVDRRADILCHNRLTGGVTVSHANDEGKFTQEIPFVTEFCQGIEFDMTVIDFNGNGKSDLYCRENGKIFLDGSVHAQGPTPFCSEDFKELISGRFLDGRNSELVCHDRLNGATQTLAVNSDGEVRLVQDDFDLGDWCLSENSDQLKAGDFNHDKLTDVLCHNDQDGTLRVRLNQGEHKERKGMFSEEFIADVEFCSEPGSALSVFDANGDGYDDLTCHTSTGRITISESHIIEPPVFESIPTKK